ncbi:hypothetical protein [Streptomyces pseudovenezuelae]|uniref:Uncharacterized protein n=1 Tax=Streptomyces pseudovenezuelae TaxID=67350 RepID=A0ABT6LEU6_9ACTN|nr:hypothetical protein [Streptomyces pseudovenezuelae]MDH6214121.1 hypothetical protein [Streptomyces pseudovenezuelae]
MGDVELLAALTKARVAVDQSMAFWVMVNGRWDEEPATVILCQNAAPYVKPITFNRTHEGIVGADWLWWWVDPSGVCFGMLVQAKNLNRERNAWSIGFGHANRSGSQLPDLLRTADHFEVPPVYVLYCGDTSYRAGLTCGDDHTEPTCTRCTRAGVSVLSALAAHELLSTGPESVAVDAFHLASPLEDLADPELPRTRFWDLNFPNCGPELRRLLVAPEYGAPQVASIIWKQMSQLRTRSYSLAVSEETDIGHSKIFENLPADRGHFPVPYFPHVLRGLRSELPSYVREAEAGRSLPSSLTDRIAGIVIFYL